MAILQDENQMETKLSKICESLGRLSSFTKIVENDVFSPLKMSESSN